MTGGTVAQKRVFYTALYRAYERMVDINEHGQYYSAYDHKVHESDEPFFVDNWIWDNYIALEPLHMILNPDMAIQRIRSYIKMYEQGGVMPSFALVFGDWCIAQLSYELGYVEDNTLFLDRSENYKNVFRVDKGIMWPRDKDGNWIEPYDPRFADRMYFTENNAFTYNWSVKHDLHGLFDLMGGPGEAEATLDQLFREDLGLPKFQFWHTQPDASGLVGQFVMGNEPSFHIPYIYNYLGAPWKTQKRIRMLLDAFFTDHLFGIPGDEDGGGMSAFVVFSMMGFFPVTPGIPVYNIGSPVFEHVTIKLPNGKEFTVIAKNSSSTNKYIQEASINGEALNKPWFTHDELMKGGTLKLIMGSKPVLKYSPQSGLFDWF